MTDSIQGSLMQRLQQDIEQLQMKVAFQEDTIEKLNEALARQQIQIDHMTFQLGHVIDKVKQIQPSNLADESEETPPPHY